MPARPGSPNEAPKAENQAEAPLVHSTPSSAQRCQHIEASTHRDRLGHLIRNDGQLSCSTVGFRAHSSPRDACVLSPSARPPHS
eukprot:2284103-Alexandrium_andersonii.AAC.1